MNSAIEIIQTYSEHYPNEKESLFTKTAFLKNLADPFARSSTEGHITASAIVVVDNKMLLIKHRYIKEWFQPGGHIDPGENPIHAAIRELEEETGWIGKASNTHTLPIDIDVHIIPANPSKQEGEHFHVDFAYYLTPIKQVTPSDPEMTDWFAIDDITAPRLVRVIQKLKKST